MHITFSLKRPRCRSKCDKHQRIERTERKREKEAIAELERAKDLKETLEQLTVELSAKSGEGGRLFGSVTSKQIAEALQKRIRLKWINGNWSSKTVSAHWDIQTFL